MFLDKICFLTKAVGDENVSGIFVLLAFKPYSETVNADL